MKKIIGAIALSGVAIFGLTGCSKPKVEVGSAQIGKIKTTTGFNKGIKNTSRFRLDFCGLPWQICDTLVLLDVGAKEINEEMSLVMPKDRLELNFTVGGTVAIDPEGYEEIFQNIPAQRTGKYTERIAFSQVYNTYAKKIINSEAREFMSQYSINEIMANREKIGNELSEHLKTSIEQRTPFSIRYTGLTDITYPPVITKAQEDSAERRETIEKERAELEVSRVKLERNLEEARLKRKIEVEKAESEAEVNRIIGESITDKYVTYKQLEALNQFARSDNTKVVPVSMLDSISGQVALGNEVSR